jgi:hypothetical protein
VCPEEITMPIRGSFDQWSTTPGRLFGTVDMAGPDAARMAEHFGGGCTGATCSAAEHRKHVAAERKARRGKRGRR